MAAPFSQLDDSPGYILWSSSILMKAATMVRGCLEKTLLVFQLEDQNLVRKNLVIRHWASQFFGPTFLLLFFRQILLGAEAEKRLCAMVLHPNSLEGKNIA